MSADKRTAQTIDHYIAGCPPEVRERLAAIRTAVREIAPHPEEAVKYGIPTFVLDGNLVHFGAYKHDFGFYPGTSGLEQFDEELAQYKRSKGVVQFPARSAASHGTDPPDHSFSGAGEPGQSRCKEKKVSTTLGDMHANRSEISGTF